MSSWSLEHIPAGAPESAVTKSLDEWGYLTAQLQFVNWGVDTLSITIGGATAATDAPLFGYLDQLVVWRDGVRVFRGWITGAPVQAEAAAEARTYTAAGAAWWLQFYPFTWYMYPEEETVADPVNRHAWRWLDYALSSAINGGAPLAVRADGLSFTTLTAPCPDLRPSASCAEVVARAARLHPLSAGWWDYSVDTPIARSAARAGLTAQVLAVGDYGSQVTLTPRPDLQLASVRIAYSYPNPTAGWPDVVDYDSAGTTPAVLGPNRLHVAIGVDSLEASSAARGFGVAQIIYDALKDLVWEGTVTLAEAETTLPLLRPGYALSLTGLREEWEEMATVIQSVTYTLAPESPDTCTIALGAPEHLGPQDYLELARAGGISGGAGGGNPGPYDPPPPPPPSDDPGTPGTYHDLNNDGTGGGSPNGTIAVEARGGEWSLVGLPPWTGDVAGQPGVRYRSVAGSGIITSWGEGGCGTPLATHAIVGSCQWGATTGALTSALRHVYVDNVTPANSFDVQIACDSSSSIWGPGTEITTTATERRVTGLNDCIAPYGIPGKWTGYNAVTRGDQDSDGDAIARMLGTSPAWVGGMTGIRTVRTAGITGVYRELRYRTQHTETAGEQIWREGYYDSDGDWVPGRWVVITVTATLPTLTGLSPWWRYRVTVALEQRPVDALGAPTGDGSWSAAGERVHYLLAGLDGEAGIDWQTIEPPAGYEIRVADTLVEVAP